MASEQLHEPADALRPETIDCHRAIVSLMEELEAVDWYAQRVDATQDRELAAVLAHNRDEEKEHAAMVLEWLRRHDAEFDKQLRNYLFTDNPILEREEELDAAETLGSDTESSDQNDDTGSLGIGSLRKELPA